MTRLLTTSILGTLCLGALAVGQEAAAPNVPPQGQREAAPTIEEVLAAVEQLKAAGRLTEARTYVDRILQTDSTNTRANLLAAQIAEIQNDLSRARTHYKAIVDVVKTHFEANLGLGRLYANWRVWRTATWYLEQAERVAPPDRLVEVRAILAAAYHGQGSQLKAVETGEKAVQEAPNDMDARWTLIEIYRAGTQFEKAMEHAAALVEIVSRTAKENPADAAALRRLLAAYEIQVDILKNYHGTLYQKDASGATTDQLAAGKRATAAATIFQVVDLLAKQAELRRILSYYDMTAFAQEGLKYAPDNPAYLLVVGQLLRRTSQLDQAIAMFQKALEVDPNNADAVRYLRELNAPLTSQPTSAPAEPAAIP